MPEVNFYLKKPAEKKDKSLIYLQFKYSGEKFVYAFGEKVHKKDWNENKQRVKSNTATTADGKHSINELLNNLERVCSKAYSENLANGAPPKSILKKALNDFFLKNLVERPGSKEKNLFALIERFIAGEIKNKGKDKSEGTIDNYRAVKKHLEEYSLRKNYRIDFDTVTLDFFYSYVSYLKNTVKLAPNTISKDITILKVFMSEAIDLGWTTNMQFRHKKFSVQEQETDAVYLKESEIIALYKFDFSKSPKLQAVRDLFVVGCFTGLRYSDYSAIKPENIIEEDGTTYIKMNTQKTGELVIIPVNPIVLEIFKKYETNNNRLPRTISNQKFNDYIKLVCKEAGLEETGRLSDAPEKELYNCISSHTARRSFATNLYLEGFPTIDLMKITGHKTEKAFLKYIRVSKLDTAKRLSEHIKKNWSSKLLKVAV